MQDRIKDIDMKDFVIIERSFIKINNRLKRDKTGLKGVINLLNHRNKYNISEEYYKLVRK